METPMPLAVAEAQLAQAMRDYTAAHDAAMGAPQIETALGLSAILTSLRDVENRGLTPTGRKSLRTAIEATKSLMGIA